ncbi:MAG TPA: hypothetical protein DD644_06370 [Halomonas sp.]|uniref:Uncharacterized protein n=1 Tax=Halomonas campaniensis TaxID=213554 RepID=A0A3D0KIU3_9GAMM|nr:hypothetical protein [Halomonas sp. 3D7M]HBP41364.1 hypothetical protein [Halomonas sp.]HBS83835.1 hypothetical protein [Halomonas campaniensis]HCA03438.1 hypothetical protein [Halomonas campaniensis]
MLIANVFGRVVKLSVVWVRFIVGMPNTDDSQEDLLDGVGVAASGPMAEMMRAPAITVFSF